VSPNCSLFHSFSRCFNLLRFSLSTNPPQPPWVCDCQHSCTIESKDLSKSQQSTMRNGLGPQSTILDLRTTGQWSEKFLSNGCCKLPGHFASHSGEIRDLSSLLFAALLGLNHANFLPIHGASSSSSSPIRSLNSYIFPSSIPLCLTPTLSEGCLMLLKSPKMHQSPPWVVDFSSLMAFHKILLFCTSHGKYMATICTCTASFVHWPVSQMKPSPMVFLSSLKVFSLHMHKIPPAELFVGCISHETLGSPHIV